MTAAPGVQTTPTQVSPVVHASPSTQGPAIGRYWQPVAGPQLVSVHGLPSWQDSTAPEEQLPVAHLSPVEHALPSSQEATLFVKKQPVAGPHASSVHVLPSLQTVAEPPTQLPP